MCPYGSHTTATYLKDGLRLSACEAAMPRILVGGARGQVWNQLVMDLRPCGIARRPAGGIWR